MSSQGVVIKINSNQRYATTAITTAILRQIATKVNVPLQVMLPPQVICSVDNNITRNLWCVMTAPVVPPSVQ